VSVLPATALSDTPARHLLVLRKKEEDYGKVGPPGRFARHQLRPIQALPDIMRNTHVV
jgi:hypothetical protein